GDEAVGGTMRGRALAGAAMALVLVACGSSKKASSDSAVTAPATITAAATAPATTAAPTSAVPTTTPPTTVRVPRVDPALAAKIAAYCQLKAADKGRIYFVNLRLARSAAVLLGAQALAAPPTITASAQLYAHAASQIAAAADQAGVQAAKTTVLTQAVRDAQRQLGIFTARACTAKPRYTTPPAP
ncbi:MAG: hypothetical protein JWM05_2271, partial [Acidimicrobiales bacterium]|nr:hypothetical protein [Acidimicrobiales bacterium]